MAIGDLRTEPCGCRVDPLTSVVVRPCSSRHGPAGRRRRTQTPVAWRCSRCGVVVTEPRAVVCARCAG